MDEAKTSALSVDQTAPKQKAVVEKSKQKLAGPEIQKSWISESKTESFGKLGFSEKKKEPKRVSELASAKTVVKPIATAPLVSNQQHPKPHETKQAKGKLALILVRGLVRIRTEIVATLYTLRLRQSHACVVIDDTLSSRAAAVKCKDYLTYGEINDETYKLLVEKRGRKDKEGKLKKYFLLHPPRGGFERKGIKTPFTTGGALGYRGAKINDLIKKML